jgi:phosphopantothenoylcysteine decarboxylase/phosphopantothenate--cysteine ligase
VSASKVLLGVTGSIGAFKSCLLLRRMKERGFDVKVVMTESATKMVAPATLHALSGHPVITDLWDLEHTSSGEIHIELTDWADVTVVYPCTADFLSCAAQGRASDALELAAMASRGPVILFPAMHHRMLSNPATRRNIEMLRERGTVVVEPEVGVLASGETGPGRLPEPETALEALLAALSPKDLTGRTILVTAGPTRERLDAVRFISNPSSGRMGYAVARVALRRGARVLLVCGPGRYDPPEGAIVTRVESAAEMASAVTRQAEDADAVVMAAAVSDFRPTSAEDGKISKIDAELSVDLEHTQDILATLGENKGERILVGFAMETQDLVERASAKLRRKNLDLVVANDLTREGAGFGHPTNVVVMVSPDGTARELPLLSKESVAGHILDRIARLLKGTT